MSVNSLHFNKEHKALITLSSVDYQLGALIRYIGDYTLILRNDYYKALIRSIVGQQLSISAARTIWDRFEQLNHSVEPNIVAQRSVAELRAIGVSNAKALSIIDISQKTAAGEVDFSKLVMSEDEIVIECLTEIKGIGRWTAEMFLIFSLGRPDVLSAGDVGLRRSIKWLYNLEEDIQSIDIQSIGQKWRPYRSVASLYLWGAVNQSLISRPSNVVLNF